MWRWTEKLSWHRVEYTYGHVYPNNVILYLNYLLSDPTRWIRGSWGFQICKQNFSTTKIDGAMAIWKSTKFSIFRQKKEFWVKIVKKASFRENAIFTQECDFLVQNFEKSRKSQKKLKNLEKVEKISKNPKKSQKISKNLKKVKKSRKISK